MDDISLSIYNTNVIKNKGKDNYNIINSKLGIGLKADSIRTFD